MRTKFDTIKGAVSPTNANLYHYAGNNPVRYVDPDGRAILGFSVNYIMQGPWHGSDFMFLGNSKSVLIRDQGCYLNGFAMCLMALRLNSFKPIKWYTPTSVNDNKSIFDGASMVLKKAAEEYNLLCIEVKKTTKTNFVVLLNAYDMSPTNYAILGKIPYKKSEPDNANHWVGIVSKPIDLYKNGEYYVEIVGTSENDIPANRPDYWVSSAGKYYVPVDKIQKLHIFSEKPMPMLQNLEE